MLLVVEKRGDEDAMSFGGAAFALLAMLLKIDENTGAEDMALLTTVDAFVCDVGVDVDEEEEAMNAAAEVDDGVKYDVIIAVPRVAQYTFPTIMHWHVPTKGHS